MRADLTPIESVQAELLLSAVRRVGTLSRAAVEIGLPVGTARKRWKQWGLDEDQPLVVGRPRRPSDF